jgi:hypothetical protein
MKRTERMVAQPVAYRKARRVGKGYGMETGKYEEDGKDGRAIGGVS